MSEKARLQSEMCHREYRENKQIEYSFLQFMFHILSLMSSKFEDFAYSFLGKDECVQIAIFLEFEVR
jgi:hypothetical protein